LVYALKSYNKQPNKKDNIGLDSWIRKISGEASAPYTSVQVERVSFVDKSIQKLAVNSIIEGCFPKENVVRQMAIKRINKTLSIIISLLIVVAVVSYYFVVSCEIKLNELSRQTVILNNENTDLQNHLDTLKSFNNVDKTFQKNNMLKRAGQVIETQEVTIENTESIAPKKKKKVFHYAIGF
jgi:hypothetical protein